MHAHHVTQQFFCTIGHLEKTDKVLFQLCPRNLGVHSTANLTETYITVLKR